MKIDKYIYYSVILLVVITAIEIPAKLSEHEWSWAWDKSIIAILGLIIITIYKKKQNEKRGN